MLGFDTVLYMALAVYFDLILPSEWGTRKHPLFCITDLFKSKKHNEDADQTGDESNIQEMSATRAAQIARFEASDEEPELGALRSQSSTFFERLSRIDVNPISVRIKGLVKKFTRTEGEFYAVNHLNLDLRENEINVLLGHNGAGKTTTINCLTGMLEIDDGDCVVYGNSVSEDLVSVRHEVGLCPQHNILWPELTCDEHLRFFGTLKGVSGEVLENSIADILRGVDLSEKRFELAGSLSGGQKRKLSVAIAFVGGSRLIILDEPTAGMDVAARRHTWDVIKNLAKGRTILLTTHFMDEADLLGHSISIMSKGKLRCQGSSTFLKSKLGVGYTLTLSVDPSDDNTRLKQLVVHNIRDAAEKQSGSEEIAFTLPTHTAPLFPEFFEKLESEGPKLGMRDMGLSMTSLEEVFLRIAEEEETQLAQFREDASGPAPDHIPLASPTVRQRHKMWEDESTAVDLSQDADFLSQFTSLLAKRFHYMKRDRRTMCLQIFTPIICIVIAFLLSQLEFIPEAPKTFIGAEMYLADKYSELRLDMSNCESAFEKTLLNPMYKYRDVTTTPNSSAFSQYLLDTFKEQSPDRFISMCCNDTADGPNAPFTALMHNGSAYHSRPEVLGLFYKLHFQSYLYRTGGTVPTVKLASHLMDWTDQQKAEIDSISTFMIAIFVLIPFTFIPSTYVSFVVKEKETKAKHLQLVSGMNYYVYWIANLAFDASSFLVTEILCMLVFAMFNRKEYLGSFEIFAAAFLLFLLYGLSSAPASYAASFFFDEHSGAQNIVMMANFICGFMLVFAIFILQSFESTDDAANVLRYIFRIIPSYAIGEGIITIGIIDLKKGYGIDVNPFELKDGIGWPLLYMALEMPLFFITALLLDHPQRLAKQQQLFHKPNELPPPIEGEDEDVLAERLRIEQWDADSSETPPRLSPTSGHSPATDAVVVQHLCKKYDSNGIVAVKNMSFGVHQREVFGFLGTNGAGKTTTISILCGEQLPTHGHAFVNGLDVVQQARAAQKQIGYCPQFDAVLDLLTAEEHLYLFAGLRGFKGEAKHKVVANLMEVSGLVEHAGTVASQLSGGNKRKLSVALALVGRPSVVFLDEPSAGMDPVARHRLWEVIQDITLHSAVVLTTHHLEEVEALSHRVAIMAEGKLMCIGDKTHLKMKYGSGYEMTVRCVEENYVDEMQKWILSEVPEATVIEYRNLRSTFALPATTKLSFMFHLLENSKTEHGIKDFTLTQTSIEQVFLRFAANAAAEE